MTSPKNAAKTVRPTSGAKLVADILDGLTGGPEREIRDEVRALREELRAEREHRG